MKRFVRRSSRPLFGSIAALLLGFSGPAFAALPSSNATWAQVPYTSDWTLYYNWTPSGPPTGTATFGTSSITTVTISTEVTIGSIVFSPGANAFTIISVNQADPSITGAGIINNSGVTQNFVAGTDANGEYGVFTFSGNASAGSNVTFTNNGATVADGFGGVTYFTGNSNAGSGIFINNGNSVSITGLPYGGFTSFSGNSSAANATLIANGGTNGGQGGGIFFLQQATGGTAKVILNSNGFLDISGLSAPAASVTIGSLASGSAGGGLALLGANNLAVGSDNTSTAFSGIIEDGGYYGGAGGSLTKIGTGALTLSGASTYTGGTIVSGGSLIVDGSLASPSVTVNSAGLLGGRGLIGGSVFNNGVVSPGDSPGTLTINRNYTQGSGGTLLIQVAGLGAGQHDLLAVGGKASLGGTLAVQALNGFKFSQVGQSVTFLTAGQGVSGTFSSAQNLSSLGGFLTNASVIYLPNAVELEATQGSILQSIEGQPGVTTNDIQTAKMLDSAIGNPHVAHLFEILNQNTNIRGLVDDIKLIDPDRLTALSNIGSAISNSTLLSLEQRMLALEAATSGAGGPAGPDGKGGKEVAPPAAPANRWGFFTTGSGDFEHIDGTSGARGFNFNAGGVTLGVDYRFSDHFVAGLYAGYTNTGVDIGGSGRIDVNDAKGGIYATYMDGGFYINSALGGGYTNYSTHRDAFGGTARSNTDGGDFTALFAPGYSITRGALTFGPTARFQYDYQGVNSFQESGSLAPMAIGSQHTESIVSGLGGKASYDWKVGSVTIRPEVLLEWEHEYSDLTTGIDGQLANGASHAYTLHSPVLGRDDLHVGAGIAVVFNERFTAYAYYDGQFFRTNYDSSTVTGGFRISF